MSRTCSQCGKSISEPPEALFAWRCPRCDQSFCRACGGGGRRVADTSLVEIGPDVMTCPKCPSPAKMYPCPNCGRATHSQEFTCHHCGHTQWGTIIYVMVLASLFLGGGAVCLLAISGLWRHLLGWPLLAFGAGGAYIGASAIVRALRKKG